MERILNVTCVVLIMVIIANTVLFLVSVKVPNIGKQLSAGDDPVCFFDPSIRWTECSEFLILGEYMYVLWDRQNTMSCYTIDGSYVCSYVFGMRKNGVSHLLSEGDNLIIHSRDHYFYVFRNGVFQTVSKPSKEQIENLNKQFKNLSQHKIEENGERFEMEGASIVRLTENEKSIVINRPLWMLLFQGIIQLVIHGVSIALILVVHYLKRNMIS